MSDQTVEDLIEACRAMPKSDALFRTLLRTGREMAAPDMILNFLREGAKGFSLSSETRCAIADFSLQMEAPDAGLLWVGDAMEEGVARVRLLLACDKRDEAVGLYRQLCDADNNNHRPDLDRALLAVAASSRQGAEIFSLTGEKIEEGGDVPPTGFQPERETISFENVGGLEDVKKQIARKIIMPFQKPNLFQRFRKKAGGGVLMYGPPGCGKTMLARATAGECGARFLNVEITNILDMYIGESEKRLAAIFDEARANTPTVLFFDELEALAARRKFSHNNNASALVSTFLNEMDGFAENNEGLLILAATNVPWAIDPAFRRPGRFDRILFVAPPDRVARLAILKAQLAGRPQEGLQLDRLVERTAGFSGADLTNLVETACDIAIEESMGADRVEPLQQDHLMEALHECKPTTLEWLSSAKNYARYANEGGLYEDVLAFLDKNAKKR